MYTADSKIDKTITKDANLAVINTATFYYSTLNGSLNVDILVEQPGKANSIIGYIYDPMVLNPDPLVSLPGILATSSFLMKGYFYSEDPNSDYSATYLIDSDGKLTSYTTNYDFATASNNTVTYIYEPKK
jgi:hypothetical protein